MALNPPSVRRVVMAHRLAGRWLKTQASPEHRIKVHAVGPSRERRALPSLLRSFRDDRVKLGTLDPITDLGVREEFDHFVLWSSDRSRLLKLAQWLESKGYETSGIW